MTLSSGSWRTPSSSRGTMASSVCQTAIFVLGSWDKAEVSEARLPPLAHCSLGWRNCCEAPGRRDGCADDPATSCSPTSGTPATGPGKETCFPLNLAPQTLNSLGGERRGKGCRSGGQGVPTTPYDLGTLLCPTGEWAQVAEPHMWCAEGWEMPSTLLWGQQGPGARTARLSVILIAYFKADLMMKPGEVYKRFASMTKAQN